MSLPPCPPMPMPARLSFPFADVPPLNPKTEPGKIINVAAENAVPPKNLRRVILFREVVVFILHDEKYFAVAFRVASVLISYCRNLLADDWSQNQVAILDV